MKISEITSFLNPFGDALATTFVLTLIILTILTVIWLLLSAKENNWEKNWYGGDLEDSANNLDGEHGSVHELSEAVATKAEKVADIMPSMLLIVGLLGTFLGLGIALNKASTVLAMADTAGMDSAMTQLMGLMDGLGAKFKTSTWGILCFIILNLLFNIFGFKEKRLTWAIKKVRSESKEKADLIAKKELTRYETLVNTLKNIDTNAKSNSEFLVKSLTTLNANNNTAQKELQDIALLTLNEHKQAIQQCLDEQTCEITKGFSALGQIKNDLNNNSLKLISSLNKAHKQTLAENDKLLSKMQVSLDENNKVAIKNSKDNIEQLKKIAGYNEATQESMQDFVKQTVGSMKSIGKSADKMAGAATAVGSSAEGLNDVVKNLRGELESIMSLIKDDLSETINHMSESFEENVTSMSKNMGEATLGISKAVAELSTSVDKTMTDVTNVIGESMELQRKSSNEFTLTSETLNVQIFEMTDLVKQLSGDITSGLKAVSESGRRMKSLDSRYARYTDLIESITETNQKLFESITDIANTIPAMAQSVPELSKALETTLAKSVKIQEDSRKAIEQLSSEITLVANTVPALSEELESTLNKSLTAQNNSNKTVEQLSKSLNEKLTTIGNNLSANTDTDKKNIA